VSRFGRKCQKLYSGGKLLKLPTFAKYPDVLRQLTPNMGMEDLLLELMKHEHASRQDNQHKRRIRLAEFPVAKTIDEMDLSLFQSVRPEFVFELASCDFVKKHQNIIMIGPPGT
jgi:DNA replication protein DnaC